MRAGGGYPPRRAAFEEIALWHLRRTLTPASHKHPTFDEIGSYVREAEKLTSYLAQNKIQSLMTDAAMAESRTFSSI